MPKKIDYAAKGLSNINDIPFTVGQTVWYIEFTSRKNSKFRLREFTVVEIGFKTTQFDMDGVPQFKQEAYITCKGKYKNGYGYEVVGRKKFGPDQLNLLFTDINTANTHVYDILIEDAKKELKALTKTYNAEVSQLQEQINKYETLQDKAAKDSAKVVVTKSKSPTKEINKRFEMLDLKES
jgi:hypothetical protein